jgi:hypothetical protein
MKRLRVGVVVGLVAVGLVGLAQPASAAVSVQVNIAMPDAMVVGQSAQAAAFSFTNVSSLPDRALAPTVSSIKLSLSCANPSDDLCVPADADPGVFTLSNAATGRSGSACGGMAFSVGAPDAGNNVTFTPASTITLPYNTTCTVDFTESVRKVPAHDVTVTDKVQTIQTVVVTLTALVLTGTGALSQVTTVDKGIPSLATNASPGGPLGTSLTDTATLTAPGLGVAPGGEVAFKLYDTACPANTPRFASTVGVVEGHATSGSFAPANAGIYRWLAIYGGDANYYGLSSQCSDGTTITSTGPPPTAVSGQADSTAVRVGQKSGASATVNGNNPTGNFTFKLFPPSNATCSGAPSKTFKVSVPATHTAHSPLTALMTKGKWRWVVVYSGDANNKSARTACGAAPLTVTVS